MLHDLFFTTILPSPSVDKRQLKAVEIENVCIHVTAIQKSKWFNTKLSLKTDEKVSGITLYWSPVELLSKNSFFFFLFKYSRCACMHHVQRLIYMRRTSELKPDLSTVTSVTKTCWMSVMLINLSGATFPQKRLSALLPSGQLVAAGALWDKKHS